MDRFPKGTGKKTPVQTVREFRGINRAECAQDGDAKEMKNITSEEYPYMCVAQGFGEAVREGDIRCAIVPPAKEGFYGVADNRIYVNGEEKSLICDPYEEIEENSKLKMFILGTKTYLWQKKENGDCLMYVSPGTYYPAFENAQEKQDFVLWGNQYKYNGFIFHIGSADGTTSSHKYRIYTDSRALGKSVSNAIPAGLSDKNYFVSSTKGDEYINGMSFQYQPYYDRLPELPSEVRADMDFCRRTDEQTTNITPNHAEELQNSRVECILYKDEKGFFQICEPIVYKNRIWAFLKEGGKVVASAYGTDDFFQFNGTSADSIEIELADKGEPIGIAILADSLLCFTRDNITVIYGDTADDFSVGKVIRGVGCRDIDSAAVCEGVLYFLGNDGFYSYTGGQPTFISDRLRTVYKKCIAYVHDGKYYAEGEKEDGTREVAVYDTRRGLWTIEEAIGIKCYFAKDGELFAGGSVGLKKRTRHSGWESGKGDWLFVSPEIYEGIFEKKGMTELNIRAKIGQGNTMRVATITQGSGETIHKTITGDGKMHVYRVPVRYTGSECYQYKLSGHGAAIIYDIERKIAPGGRKVSDM